MTTTSPTLSMQDMETLLKRELSRIHADMATAEQQKQQLEGQVKSLSSEVGELIAKLEQTRASRVREDAALQTVTQAQAERTATATAKIQALQAALEQKDLAVATREAKAKQAETAAHAAQQQTRGLAQAAQDQIQRGIDMLSEQLTQTIKSLQPYC